MATNHSNIFLVLSPLISSVAQSWPHGLQHTRLPCSSPAPEACSNTCPSSWCHPTISSRRLLLLPSIFPPLGSFPLRQFFPTGSQSIGVSASVLPVNIQGWSPLGWAGWISLKFKGFSRVFFNTTVWKQQFFSAQLSLWSNSHIYLYVTTGKTIVLTIRTFFGKVMTLLFNMLV